MIKYKDLINKVKKLLGRNDKKHKESYSQCGEDMIIDFIFNSIGVSEPSYLDVGANDPKRLNNTYYFYKYKHGKGVLVEPNPLLSTKLKKERPLDVHLNCGIGFKNIEEEADYYVMDWHEFNTFSKDAAIQTQKHYGDRNKIKEVLKIKLVNINQIFEKYFQNGIDMLSIDVEGLDLEIIKSINFEKYKPKTICIETKVGGRDDINTEKNEIRDYLSTVDYSLVAQTPINGIYVSKTNMK